MTGSDESSREPGGEHPAADALADFAEGTLPLEDAQQVRRHLDVCTECHELIQDLSRYPVLETLDEAFQVDEEELRSTLGALRARALPSLPIDPDGSLGVADASKREAPKVGVSQPEPTAPRPTAEHTAHSSQTSIGGKHGRSYWPLLAAALILLALGWGWRRHLASHRLQTEIVELRQQLAAAENKLRLPWANVKVVRLFADNDPLRSSSSRAFSLKNSGITVIIQTPEPLTSGLYVGEIRKPSGEVVLRIEDLEPQTVGISFFLTAAALEPGDYQLWLLRNRAEVYPTPFELRVFE